MKYRPDRDKEIANLKLELAGITELKETRETRGWKQLVAVFQKYAGQFAQDAYDKCKHPERHAMEIRCKKMIADTLGSILLTLDARVADEEYVRKQFAEKLAAYNDAIDRQKLVTL